MRLTLRTLLAYLDDRLSPANARELGQKISKSPFAQDLADRIRDVVRRRRLASDAPVPRTIDANLLAEYLDDQLTPELVALIEKEILASDHSLAEVAAAHQVLGLLTDPVEVSADQKERLYALDPSRMAADVGEEPEFAEPQTEVVAEWQPLTPRTQQQRRSPLILLTAMVLGWFALLATDANLFNHPESPSITESAGESGGAAGVPQVISPEPVVAGKGPTGAGGSKVDPVPSSVAGTPPVALPPPVAGGKADAAVGTPLQVPNAGSAKSADPATIVATERGAVQNMSAVESPAGKPTDQPESEMPTTVVPQEPATVAAVGPADNAEVSPKPLLNSDAGAGPVDRLNLTDRWSMLIMQHRETGSWSWGTSVGHVPGDDWRATLSSHVAGIAEPFAVRIDSPDAGWTADVLGSTLFRAAPDQNAGIELIDGRMIFRRAAGRDKTALAGVTVADHHFSVSVADEETRVAVAVNSLGAGGAPAGDPTAELSTASALPVDVPKVFTVYAAESDVVVRRDDVPDAVTLTRGNVLHWHTTKDAPEPVESGLIMPEWIFRGALPAAETTHQMLVEMSDKLRKSESISGAATEISTDRNPLVAAYAVQIPVLIRSADDLCSILLQSEIESVRREAIAGLQKIAAETPQGPQIVASAMEKRLGEMELESAVRLIVGVTPTAAEDPEVCAWLVGMLESKRTALRELAITNLERLTGERNGFFAGDDAGRRDSALRRWHRILERNDGRLGGSP